MAERCFLAVDLGAESGRVVAGLFDGERLRLEEIHRFPNGAVPVAGTLRWDVLRLWSEIQAGLAKGAQSVGQEAVSVGVDTWGVDFVLLTKSGEMLGQPYHYRDPRTKGVMEHCFSRVPRAEIFATTGLQFMGINTLYQLVAMRQANPRLMDLADRFLMMPDLFHWLLCGSQVVEFTNATTSQCLDATTRQWGLEMLARLEIPGGMFPEVVSPGTRLGPLRSDVAERCRLPRLEVITPATHDTGSAVVAAPTDQTGRANWAYISSGTWSLMGLELNQAVLTPQALAYNVTNEGGSTERIGC
ncbi:MAG: rhamnulokinase family protein [Planctomycetales bacterium]